MHTGVASHEGRVLIMTTNKPENLDAALIRPGRVDLQVEFTNATQPQIRELFERMYGDDIATRSTQFVDTPVKSKALSSTATTLSLDRSSSEKKSLPEEPLSETELTEIASKFAAKIPDGVFSPAEIQGFLLKRKKEPRKAADEVGNWVKEMQQRREHGNFS